MGHTFGKDDDIPVSGADDVFVDRRDRKVWKLGEFDATNAPLSAWEIEHRRHLMDHGKWGPLTLEKIQDMAPVPEHELQLK